MVNTLLAIFIKNELVIHNDAFFYPVKKIMAIALRSRPDIIFVTSGGKRLII